MFIDFTENGGQGWGEEGRGEGKGGEMRGGKPKREILTSCLLYAPNQRANPQARYDWESNLKPFWFTG